jgi:cysteine-rich repeat protein
LEVDTTDATGSGTTDSPDPTTGAPEEAVCGDGVVGAGEACDHGDKNGVDGVCSVDCQEEEVVCGDGVVSGDEACDDGANNGPDHACTANCTLNVCGDGFVGPGEACDEGAANADNGTCTTQCKPPVCGDGVVNAGEECDLGPGNGDDQACTSMCKNAACGDGLVGPGEGCDDGNQVDDDACTNACGLASCGDGVKQMGEACDDKNQVDTDACLATCVAASCGDGFVFAGSAETCDDGNADNTDSCTTLCLAPSCNDKLLSGEEEDVDCGGSMCKPCYGLFQHKWKGTQMVAAGPWTKIAAADADITTRGGPLEIELSIPMVGGGDSACRPTIDGMWAGSFEGLPEQGLWHEGRERTNYAAGKGYRMWRRVRAYNNIPAGSHKLGVQCLTNAGALAVGRQESTSTIVTREYDGVKNKVYQKVVLQGTKIAAASPMAKMVGSDLTFDSAGGDIEVAISLPIGGEVHAACLPYMDGIPMKSIEQAYTGLYWDQGLEASYGDGGGWMMWTHSRLYRSIDPGTHTFSIRCHHDGVNGMNVGDLDSASVLLVRELDNGGSKVAQGLDKNGDGWKVSGGVDSKWYALSDHLALIKVTHGNLDVTEWAGYRGVADGGWLTCRPVANGAWIGALSGGKFTSNEEEGVVRQMGPAPTGNGNWYRRRIYSGIPAGEYLVGLECLSNAPGFNLSGWGQGTLTVRDVPLLGDI